MSATPSQTLIDAAKCYLCLGMSQGEAMAIAMWDTISQNASPPPVTGNTLTLTPPVGAPTVVTNPTGNLDYTDGTWVSAVALDCPNLTGLNFDGNLNLTTLTLTNCPLLATLTVSESGISSLNLTGTKAAWNSLQLISNNSLATINASQMTSITTLLVDDNDGLTAMNFSAVVNNAGSISITGNAVLAAINFAVLTDTGNLDLHDNASVTSINFSSLVSVSGDIDLTDDTSLTSAVFGGLTSLGGSFLAVNCTALTTINLSAIGIAGIGGNLTVTGCTSLTALNLVSCQSISGNITVTGCTSLTTPNFTALGSVTILTLTGCSSLVTLAFPAFNSCGDSINISNNPALTTLNLGALPSVPVDFSVFSNASLTTLTLTNFSSYGNSMVLLGNTSFVSVNLSALTGGGPGGFDISGCTALTTITLNANWPFPDATTTNCSNCALNQATVNAFIDKAFATSPTSSTVDLSLGTSSAPSAPEAALVVTLNLAGNNFTTN